MRKLFYAVLITALLAQPSFSSVIPKAGAKCSKVGITQIFEGIRYTCIKSGTRLLWNKGVVLPGATPIKQGDISFWLYEGTKFDFIAPNGFVIDKVDAWYGSATDFREGLSVSSKFTESVGERSFTFVASNHILSDPAFGKLKKLSISIYLSQREKDCLVSSATQSARCELGDRLIGSFNVVEKFQEALLYEIVNNRSVLVGEGFASTMPWGPDGAIYCGESGRGGPSLWVCPSIEITNLDDGNKSRTYFWKIDGVDWPSFTVSWILP